MENYTPASGFDACNKDAGKSWVARDGRYFRAIYADGKVGKRRARYPKAYFELAHADLDEWLSKSLTSIH